MRRKDDQELGFSYPDHPLEILSHILYTDLAFRSEVWNGGLNLGTVSILVMVVKPWY